MARNQGRTLTDEEKDTLAYEIALGYFTDEELNRRFKLQPHALKMYKASEALQTQVLDHQRKLDESDFALRVHARRAARLALTEYIKIVQDSEAPAKTRMEAGKQIREIASGVDKDVLAGDPPEGMLILKTNLDLEGAKGTYAITAADIEEQMRENEDLKAAAAAQAASQENDREMMELLGI